MSESFAELFEQSLASSQIKSGTILTGSVIEISPEVVIVSAGLKSEAVIPTSQFLMKTANSKFRSATMLKLPWMPLKTVRVKRAFPGNAPSAPVPGRRWKRPSRNLKL